MRRLIWTVGILAVIAGGGVYLLSQNPAGDARAAAQPKVATFRVLFGLGDTEPTRWDGSVESTGAQITAIRGWRFALNDSTDLKTSWKLSTRRGMGGPAANRAGRPGPMMDNGVLISAVVSDPSARFTVKTAQGEFSFTAAELPWGEAKQYFNNKALVERVPATEQITTSDEDQDYPALARSGDSVYLAYVEFTHGDRWKAVLTYKEAPANFDDLARPAGGDQVLLREYSPATRTWKPAEAVSERGQDVFRTAVAVDGKKRVWVIWSAQKGGNFDLYAKRRENGRWSGEIQLTSDPGNDLNPVAVADAAGRVWVAWQGFRAGSLDVLAAALDGDRFTSEVRVSASKYSDWDPAIAAAPNGDIAVAWDTYEKGDYDVMFRKLRWNGRIAMDAPVTAAGSDKFEARASIAFDPRNRLWVAYEGSETKWGKDFGAYETTGVALYQGHTIKVKVFEGARALVTADNLAEALPGPPTMQARARRRARPESPAPTSPVLPNPELAKRRAPSGTPQPGPNLKNSFPRIAVDGQGMVYLALRTVTGVRTPVGSVWQQTVLNFDGEKWSDVIPVPNTDGLLDVRPALLPVENGRLLMAAISDHRQTFTPGAGAGRRSDSVNSDIYAAEFDFAGSRKNADKLTAAPAESGALSSENKAEIDMVGRMRAERVTAAGAKVQLLRGEFHRHTEISGDGGGDGPIIDAYRYMIDAAYMDWGGCCDHDNGGGREYFWWISQKLTDAYNLGPHFVNMFSYERSVRYPEGHRNTVFAQRGIRPLPRLPKVADDAPFAPAPDTQMLYRYLRQFKGIVASHTSGTDMGTDWRDNDPLVEPVVEIYQGDRQNYEMPGAPRSNNEKDSIGAWRPLGFVSNALQKGYRLGFQASSDHVSTHMSYCNLWVKEPTREGVMEAFRARRVYGATDNILADVRCGEHFMGEEFTLLEPPAISVRLMGMAPFSKVLIVKNGAVVYSAEPNTKEVKFTWRDAAPEKGKTSYYYVRGEQQDDELVWVSPMWITVK